MLVLDTVVTDVAGLLEAELTFGNAGSYPSVAEKKQLDVKRQLAEANGAYLSVVLRTYPQTVLSGLIGANRPQSQH